MIGFESEEVTLQKLRERLRNMSDTELVQFGKIVSKLSAGPTGTSNPFKRQLEEARSEWKRRIKTSRLCSWLSMPFPSLSLADITAELVCSINSFEALGLSHKLEMI